MKRRALVDGDIIVYSCGFASDIREWHCPDGKIFSYSKEAKAYCEDNGLDKKDLNLKSLVNILILSIPTGFLFFFVAGSNTGPIPM